MTAAVFAEKLQSCHRCKIRDFTCSKIGENFFSKTDRSCIWFVSILVECFDNIRNLLIFLKNMPKPVSPFPVKSVVLPCLYDGDFKRK